MTYLELREAYGKGLVSIGRAAASSGVSAKMIRHYEAMGLLPATGRTVAGYRIYRESDIHMLQFIRRARDLGFSMKETTALVRLWQNRRRASGDVKKLAARHLQHLDEKIREMQAMRDSLAHLAQHCRGDDRPDCPILEDLAADLPHCSEAVKTRPRGVRPPMKPASAQRVQHGRPPVRR